MSEPLAGWKTYIVAGALVAWSVLGIVLGKMEPTEAIRTILEALGIASLRLGVAKR